MDVSKEVLQAVETALQYLQVDVDISTTEKFYDTPARISVKVRLFLKDELISESESSVEVPS